MRRQWKELLSDSQIAEVLGLFHPEEDEAPVNERRTDKGTEAALEDETLSVLWVQMLGERSTLGRESEVAPFLILATDSQLCTNL